MKKAILLIPAAVSLLLFAGCASMSTGGHTSKLNLGGASIQTPKNYTVDSIVYNPETGFIEVKGLKSGVDDNAAAAATAQFEMGASAVLRGFQMGTSRETPAPVSDSEQ